MQSFKDIHRFRIELDMRDINMDFYSCSCPVCYKVYPNKHYRVYKCRHTLCVNCVVHSKAKRCALCNEVEIEKEAVPVPQNTSVRGVPYETFILEEDYQDANPGVPVIQIEEEKEEQKEEQEEEQK